jgi:5-methylcytosine-specific restriction protein A
MQRKEDFINWLKNNTKLSSSSIVKYANAIKTISIGLGRYGLLVGSLYNITDPVIIESITMKYLSVPEFSDKDIRGNRMYSNALKYYYTFIRYLNDNGTKSKL